MADIHVNLKENTESVIKIIPFYDRDKSIAKSIEKVLTQYLKYENDIQFNSDDFETY